MGDKVKLLLVPSDLFGVGNYRNIWPGKQIDKENENEFYIEIQPGSDITEQKKEYYKQFDIIHFHRHFGPYEIMPKFFKELKDSGVTLIMDIDDYWNAPPTHPMHYNAKKEKLAEKTIETMKNSDWVTTTTNIFAGFIKEHNSNVFVLPNAIDPQHRMWQEEDIPKTDKIKVTWIGGSSHLHDLEILRSSLSILHSDDALKNKYQIVMCGYDIRGSVSELDQAGNHIRTRKIQPSETVWNKFEEIFTDNYKITSEEYKKWLKTYKNEPYPFGDINDSLFIRRWTLPVTQYGKHYNHADICLAPLVESTFNAAKSELKIIEAGMKKKALIAQDFGIYKELLTNGENGLLINSDKNHRGWYDAIKKLIVNKDLREKLANNLHEFVKDKYHISNVTKTRFGFYKDIIKSKKQKEELIIK